MRACGQQEKRWRWLGDGRRRALLSVLLLAALGGRSSAGSVGGRSAEFPLRTKDASIGEPALSAAIAERSGLFVLDTRAGVQRSAYGRSGLFTVDTLVETMALVIAAGGQALPGTPPARLDWTATAGHIYGVEIVPVWESLKPTYPFTLIAGNPEALVRVWQDRTAAGGGQVSVDLANLGLLQWDVGGTQGSPRDWATQFPAGRYDVTVVDRGTDGTGTDTVRGPLRLHRYHVWKQAGSAAARPLLFVNGWAASNRSTARSAMTEMADDFAADHACYLLEYGDTDDHAVHNIPALAAAVDLIRAAHPGEAVDLVCHSAGGLLARYYKHELHNESKVGRIVCLGTPHRGSPLAETVFGAALDGYGALADDIFKPLTRMLRNPQQPNTPNAAYGMTLVNSTAFQMPFTADDAERQDIIFVAGRKRELVAPGLEGAIRAVAHLFRRRASLWDSDGVVPFTSAAYTPADAAGVRCLSLNLNHVELNDGLGGVNNPAARQARVHAFIAAFLDGNPAYVTYFGRYADPIPPITGTLYVGLPAKGSKAATPAGEPGALVLRQDAEGNLVLLGVTGDDGTAGLQFEPGEHYDLVVAAAGYEPELLAVDVPSSGTMPDLGVTLEVDPAWTGPRSAVLGVGDGTGVTPARAVTLGLACEGADEMRFSESPIFGDGPAWVPFAESADFVLADAAGPHVVFAEFRSNAGGPEQTVLASASIVYQDAGQNLSPAMPEQLRPGYAAAAQPLTPRLAASAFSDPDGDTHAHSQWQVDDDSGFGSPAWDTGDGHGPTTEATVAAGTLGYASSYFWRVRYQDSRGASSAWSPGRPFSSTGRPGDFYGPSGTADGQIDGQDLGFFAEQWHERYGSPDLRCDTAPYMPPEDPINGVPAPDGRINGQDLGRFAALWDLRPQPWGPGGKGGRSAAPLAAGVQPAKGSAVEPLGGAEITAEATTLAGQPVSAVPVGGEFVVVLRVRENTVRAGLALAVCSVVFPPGQVAAVAFDPETAVDGGVWSFRRGGRLDAARGRVDNLYGATLAKSVGDGTPVRLGADGTAVLTLVSEGADPVARGMQIRTSIAPLEGGWAGLRAFCGKGYGQTLAW